MAILFIALFVIREKLRECLVDVIDTYYRRPDKTLIMVSHYEEELPANITHRLVL
ncbi:MAG: hypothetical protein IKX59_04865 [Bacteroidales bacterium]|nr:hypothetical protein [Bacteroidales bacterium]